MISRLLHHIRSPHRTYTVRHHHHAPFYSVHLAPHQPARSAIPLAAPHVHIMHAVTRQRASPTTTITTHTDVDDFTSHRLPRRPFALEGRAAR